MEVTQEYHASGIFCVTIFGMMLDATLKAPASPGLTAAIRSLLRHFHRQSPIRGGSLLITLFGDSIAPRGGAVSLGSLIDLAQPFELTERLVRTSVARLAKDGWLIARRDGRRSEYRLSAVGQERFSEATTRIYGEIPRTWDRRWTLLLLPRGIKKQRQDVEEELRWLGFGQISPGMFAHPNWSLEQARAGLHGVAGAAHGLLMKSQSEGQDTDRRLVASGWDLGDLTRRYSRFVDVFNPVLAAVTHESHLPGEAAFIIRTLLIHEYRKIHLQDPLLPPELLPSAWVGSAAYELSKQLYAKVFAAAERYLSDNASTMTEPLPPANQSAHERFGGLTA